MNEKLLRSIFLLSTYLAIPVALNGCAGPAVFMVAEAVGIASVAYGGYMVHRLTSGGSVEFQIERNDPEQSALKIIRSSKRLVIFPSGGGDDGQDVDIFRAKTDFTVISSTDALKWQKRSQLPPIASMPEKERIIAAGKLARATNADIVLFAEGTMGDTKMNIFFGPLSESGFKIKTKLINARDNQVLWSENHQLKVNVGSSMPAPQEISKAASLGIAGRIMEIRTGRRPS